MPRLRQELHQRIEAWKNQLQNVPHLGRQLCYLVRKMIRLRGASTEKQYLSQNFKKQG